MADEAAPKRRAGRPRKAQSERVLTADLRILVTPEMKEWVLNNGGSEMVRNLISDEQKHRDALRGLLATRIKEKEPLQIAWHGDYGSGTVEGEVAPIPGHVPGLEFQVLVYPLDGSTHYLVTIADIDRVQEPGDNGAILWEK